MARRRKGRDISGWLLVDKPAGLTSSAVVGKVRWAFDARKAGHAGTLDPAATGLLAIALGEATKTVPFVTDALKAYAFGVRFGTATDTDDADGDVIATSPVRPETEALRAALPAFEGTIMQVPPAYSAVKVDGARAYDLARTGAPAELAARPLFVERLTLTARPDPDHAEFELVCGKGGYVRAIARDLGRAFGGDAHVTWLRRLWAGPFTLADAVTLNEVEAGARTEALDTMLMPLEAGLADLPCVTATQEGAARLRNGNPGEVATGAEFGAVCWARHAGQPVAIGTYRGGLLHPSRVFNL
ncbi:MAG: tRNA pseudouridine(55) synthase TruB [Pseudomonadota bacterium]